MPLLCCFFVLLISCSLKDGMSLYFFPLHLISYFLVLSLPGGIFWEVEG